MQLLTGKWNVSGGEVGNGISYNGSQTSSLGDVLDNIFNATPKANFTITGWAKTNTLPTGAGGGNIITKSAGGAGPYEWIIYHDTDGYVKWLVASDSGAVNYTVFKNGGGAPIPINEWFFFAAVFDGSKIANTKLALYVNGTTGSTSGSAGQLGPWCANTFTPITFGGVNPTTNNWNGTLADVRIYSRALTQVEATNLWLMGNSSNSNITNNSINATYAGINVIGSNNTVLTNNTINASGLSGVAIQNSIKAQNTTSTLNNLTATIWVSDNGTSNVYNSTTQGNIYYYENGSGIWSVKNGSNLNTTTPSSWSTSGYGTNATTFPSFWVGSGSDWWAWTANSASVAAKYYGWVFPNPLATMASWTQYVTGSIIWKGGPTNTSMRLGTYTAGDGILVMNGSSQHNGPISWCPE